MGNKIVSDSIGGLDMGMSYVKQIQIPDESTYKSILDDMVLAFLGQRKGCETERKTEEYCRDVLKTCVTSFHKDGKVWKSAPGKNVEDWYESLMMRLRVFKYDLKTKTLIKGHEKTVTQKIKDLANQNSDKKPAKLFDRSFSLSEQANFEKFIDKFKEDFESNITIVDELMIRRLAFLYVLGERDITHVDLSRDLTKEINELAQSLGVAGKQRINMMNSERTGTLELLTTKYKRTLDEFIEIETRWRLEELKLISNAVHRSTTPEFLAMSWVKALYGSKIDGNELSIENVDKFLRKNNINA
jgi:hypothetical protein